MTAATSSRREAARWGTAFALAALAHGTLAVAVLANWQVPEPAGTPVLIELDMLAAAPEMASAESVPGPEQTQTEPAAEPEKAETPPEEPAEHQVVEQLPSAESPVMVAKPEPKKPEPKKPEPKKSEPKKPEPKREVKKPEPKREVTKREPKPRAVAATTAPSAADTVASIPSPGLAGSGSSTARPSWNSRILAHLQRHKRYPAEAQARGESGVARLSFVIDRGGHVLSSHLAGSSGYASLDRETAALILRAQPLPPAPPELAGARFSFSVPIRYSMR
jgi:protein TonB